MGSSILQIYTHFAYKQILIKHFANKILSKHDILIQLIDYYCNGNKAEFARKLGVKPQSINTWLSRDSFDIDLIYSKCEFISGDWLLSGKGSMLTNSITVATENLQEVSQYKKDLAAKDEIIALKDSIIRRSDKLTDALEGRIKELESKLSSYEVQGLGSALNVGQYTSFAPGLPIKK